MQDIFDIYEQPIPQEEAEANLLAKYNYLLSSLSVRTVNVLNAWREQFADDISFLYNLLAASHAEIISRKNCGRKTYHEILDLQKSLKYNRIIVSIEPGG